MRVTRAKFFSSVRVATKEHMFIDAAKEGIEMKLNAPFLHAIKGKSESVIPLSNICYFELEEIAAPAPAKERSHPKVSS